MAQSQYLRRVQAINRTQPVNDVQRGMEVGQSIGKMMGGLSEAIKSYQKDQLANKLMNTQDAPRAALVSAGGPQPSQQGIDSADPNADLSTDLPSDVSQTIGGSAPNLNQAAAAQQLSGSPGTVDPNADLSTDLPENVSSTQSVQVPASPGLGINTAIPATTTYSGTGIDPTLASNVAAAQLSSAQPSAQPTATGVAPGVSTAGTKPHTGGMAELELQKEMLAQQLQKAQLAKATAPEKAPDPMDAALKQVQLAQARKNLLRPDAVTKTAVDKTSLASNMDTEPVTDQDQLVRTYDSTHGKGAFDDTVSAFNAPDTAPDPTDPTGKKTIPNTPRIVGNTVTLNPNSKNPVTLQLGEAQTIAKQLNTRRIAQGLPSIPVPGVDPTLGSTMANPIPVSTKLDGASIPHGKWIRVISTGQVIRRP